MGELRSLKTPAALVDADVVEKLEEALARAKEGGVSGVALAMVREDGAVQTAFSRTQNTSRLIGAVTLLQHQLVARWNED